MCICICICIWLCNPCCQCEVEVSSGWHFREAPTCRSFALDTLQNTYLPLVYLPPPNFDTFENTHWRKLKKIQLVQLCIGFATDTFHNPYPCPLLWLHYPLLLANKALMYSTSLASLCNAFDLATSYILSDFPKYLCCKSCNTFLILSYSVFKSAKLRFGYKADCQICENWKGEKEQQRYSGDKQPIFVRQIRDKKTGKRDKECWPWWL